MTKNCQFLLLRLHVPMSLIIVTDENEERELTRKAGRERAGTNEKCRVVYNRNFFFFFCLSRERRDTEDRIDW